MNYNEKKKKKGKKKQEWVLLISFQDMTSSVNLHADPVL